MAFDKPTRNRLASFVAEARSLIVAEFTEQFQSLFGISAKCDLTPLDKLGHLDDVGLATAALLRERIDYLEKTHPDDKDGRKAAVARLAREQAFTILNRLAAIRMAEKRGLIVESVGQGYQSRGFKVFEQVAGSGLGDTYHRYRRYLFCLFDELAIDLGILFDRRSPQALLFPQEPALLALLDLLHAADLEPLWAEDETIGWIYQYYNDPEERKKMRKESAAPRNSRELAVRNQFFTPRYVVEFLTDNTLGRIWYEMTKGETRLAEQCRYLARRATEIFLAEGEAISNTPAQEGLSQEELLKQPVHIPHRPLKDPREIRLLDPACGSMHFGLYAFDLFETIYEEAWDHCFCPALQEIYRSKDEFLKNVPRLIIEHNIHGIDIDARAVQIAGLSLWLRAQKAWQGQGVKPADRPRVRRSNIVCAEPMPGSPEMLEDFTNNLDQPLLGELVKTVFDKMQLAGEAGSLLKIEEEIRIAIDTARKAWEKIESTPRQLSLTEELNQSSKAPNLAGLEKALTTDFWDTAEQQVIDALRAYAEQADVDSYQRRLFADDAARGFAFIDLCRKRYDAVVMNPPFGEPALRTISAVENTDATCSNLFCAFVVSLTKRLESQGKIGAITDRSFVVKSSYEDYRNWLYQRSAPELYVDLGWGVLDANVEVGMYTVCSENNNAGFFGSVSEVEPDDKHKVVRKLINLNQHNESLKRISFRTFENLPNSSMSFTLPLTLLRDFETGESLGNKWGRAARGMSSGKTAFACRLIWEIPIDEFGQGKTWHPANVGGGQALFFRPVFMAFYHGNSWGPMVAFKGFSLKNTHLFWRTAIGWGKRTDLLSCQLISPDSITAEDGQLYVPNRIQDVWGLLAFMNSKYAQAAVHAICGGHKGPGYVDSIPFPIKSEAIFERLGALARQGYQLEREIGSIDEATKEFVNFSPFIKSVTWVSETLDWITINSNRVNNLIREVDDLVYKALQKSLKDIDDIEQIAPGKLETLSADSVSRGSLFKSGLSYFVGAAFGRWDIRNATGERQPAKSPDPFDPLPVCPPAMLQSDAGLPAEPKEVPADYPLRISWPGILVDDDNHPEDIVARVQESIQVIWKDRAETIEQEACEILSVKTLREYFRRPAAFFADHLKRYSKSRRQAPIYLPLSTKSDSYTLWLYYHRLTDQTLHTCLADFLDPKLKKVQSELDALNTSGQGGTRSGELHEFLDELHDLRDEIERIIKLPWKPNLNDGVLITASPLHKLFRLPKWQKDLKACWDNLVNGDYDWAHLAYSIWPKRVEEACKKDRSIAIAHNLEHLCQVKPPKSKTKRRIKNASIDFAEGE